ncbi:MAG TPA: 4'-phosphopantetheinyl transferase superfamily protein [Noviherbaspirillum sp.]
MRPDALFDFDLPPLPENAALCIGLTIDWRQHDALHAYAMRHTLTDEHARAARFLQMEDRLRNLLGRTMLRHVAVHYGGMDHDRVIRCNTWGKPQPENCTVGCNVSHSGTQVWVAVSRHAHVGIDVESVDGTQELEEVAAAFHPDEITALRTTPGGKLAALRCWSRKEAVSKATGMGLSLPLRAYAVECSIRPAGWLRVAPPSTTRMEWTTVDLPVGRDHVGALAVKGRCDHIDVLHLKTFMAP